MKKLIIAFSLASIIVVQLGFVFDALANVWTFNQTVTKLNSYGYSTGHFVWTSGGPGSECTAATSPNPVLTFDESIGAGKSLFALLLSAMSSGLQVDIQTSVCNVVEVYIHPPTETVSVVTAGTTTLTTKCTRQNTTSNCTVTATYNGAALTGTGLTDAASSLGAIGGGSLGLSLPTKPAGP